jgi:hypothetical protein
MHKSLNVHFHRNLVHLKTCDGLEIFVWINGALVRLKEMLAALNAPAKPRASVPTEC